MAAAPEKDWKLKVHHINVGAGDSTLICLYSVTSMGDGGAATSERLEKAVLVDTGMSFANANDIQQILGANLALSPNTFKKLDAIVITHYDRDHVGGFRSVFMQDRSEFRDRYVDAGTVIYDQGNTDGAKTSSHICPYKDTLGLKELRATVGIHPNGGNRMLGKELFWGGEENRKEGQKEEKEKKEAKELSLTLEDLRGSMGESGGKKKPALFCIGVNQSVLKPKPKALNLFPDKEPTPQNKNSIILILVSPKDEILYYLGGDSGEGGPENNVAIWLEAQGYIAGSGKRIEVMKLSHHGAVNGTPRALLKSFNPLKAVVSAGRLHRHPRIELLLYIYYSSLLLKNDPPTMVVATNCPYWLDYDPEDKKEDRDKALNRMKNLPEDLDSLKELLARDNDLEKLTNRLAELKKENAEDYSIEALKEFYKGNKTEFFERIRNFWNNCLMGTPKFFPEIKQQYLSNKEEQVLEIDIKNNASSNQVRSTLKQTSDNEASVAFKVAMEAAQKDQEHANNDVQFTRGFLSSVEKYIVADAGSKESLAKFLTEKEEELERKLDVVKSEEIRKSFYRAIKKGINGEFTKPDFVSVITPIEEDAKLILAKANRVNLALKRAATAVGSTTTTIHDTSQPTARFFHTSVVSSNAPLKFISSASTQKDGTLLLKDSDLDVFVALLPSKTLMLDAYNKPENNDSFSIQNGLIGGELGDWFKTLGLNQFNTNFSGSLIEKELKVDNNDNIHFEIILDNLTSNHSPINFHGKLEVDNTLVFKLAETSSLSTSLFDNARFTRYIESDENGLLMAALNALFEDQLTFPLSNNTCITFDPEDNCRTHIELVSAIQLISIGELKFDNISFGFISESAPLNHDKKHFIAETVCYFDANLNIGEFEANIRVSLDRDAKGIFSFSPSSSKLSPIGILQELSQKLFPQSSLLDKLLEEQKFEINVLKQAVISFDLSIPKLISIEFLTELKFKGYQLTTHLLLPQGSLWGNLSPEKIEIVQSPAQDLDQEDEDEPVELSNYSFSGMASEHDIKLPDDKFKEFKLANLSFSASPASKSYSFEVNLNNGKNSLWSFNDEITLKNINFSLTQNSETFNAQLGSTLQLGKTIVSVEAVYSSRESWSFSADISYIPLSDITHMFIKELKPDFSVSFPNINLEDIKVSFNLGNPRTFHFEGTLLIGSATFSVSASSNPKLITASWTNTGNELSLAQLVSEIGIGDLPIPEGLNFNFQSAKFDYLMTKDNKMLVFRLTMQEGGQKLDAQLILFSSSTTNNAFQPLFTLSYNFPDSISGVPLINEVSLPVQNIEFWFSSSDVSSVLKDEINKNLDSISNSDWRIPEPLDATKPVINQGAEILIRFDNSLSITPIVLSLSTTKPTALKNTHELFKTQPPILRDPAAAATPSLIKWVKIQKTLGPIQLNRLGLGYRNQHLIFSLDADLLMGGLTVKLAGLSAEFNINALSSMPSFSLNGLAIDYSNGPLEIGGGFIEETPQPQELVRYSGSAVFKTEFLNIAAIGSYAKLKNGDTSLFIFGRTNPTKPFGGPPYFYVTGFAGGFGYNQHLRLPDPNEVVNFPLVQGTSNPAVLGGEGADLMTVLQKLEETPKDGLPWLSSCSNENWFAVGLDFTTFELVQTKALLVAEFGKEFALALLGRSWMQLPKVGSPLAYVEMGIKAILKPSEGFLGITAVLSSNSYVFDPACHLTGGFAFYLWFEGEHAGDFVVTLGGYHPNFVKPAHYPDEPRLGFNWHVSNEITISGGSYFALTPSCVMAGGNLNALFHSGDLKAWFKAYADFLIDWAPFHYEVRIGVDVGASYRLNLLFTSVTFEVDIGANLTLWGPSLGGEVHVDWYIISFTIGFGAGRAPLPKMDWDSFKELLPNKSTNTAKLAATTSGTEVCKFIVKDGLIRQEKVDEDHMIWIVRPDEFCFQIESAIPLTDIDFGANDWKNNVSSAPFLNIKPMGLSNISSKHEVKITAKNSAKLMSDSGNKNDWQSKVLLRNVPESLWGEPSEHPPSSPSAKILQDYWVGLMIKAPESSFMGTPPAPMNITKAFGGAVIEKGSGDMPLTATPNPDNSITATDKDSGGANIQEIAKDIATPAIQEKRNLLFQYLKKSNFLASLEKSDTMVLLANNAKEGKEWSESPMSRAQPHRAKS